MQDEPIIFVEVALTKAIPSNIQNILQKERNFLEPEEAKVAVFYSISNCQKGLTGISFGNFLIKQVATDLSYEFKNLHKFVTLSPIPGFRKWLRNKYPKMDVKIEKIKKPDQLSKIKETMSQTNSGSDLFMLVSRSLCICRLYPKNPLKN